MLGLVKHPGTTEAITAMELAGWGGEMRKVTLSVGASKTIFTWTETNCREHHCRIGRRIVGKIYAPPGSQGWDAVIRMPKLRWIGYRVDPAKARLLVERAVEMFGVAE